MSSAYCWWLSPYCFNISAIGETKVVKSKGPSTDPCGTPVLRAEGADALPSTTTEKERPVR